MQTLVQSPAPVAALARRPMLLAGLLLGSLLPLLAQVLLLAPHRVTAPVSLDKLPIQFVPSPQREDGTIQMRVQALGGTVSFRPGQVMLALPDSDAVRIQFAGANINARIVGGEQLPGVANDFRGNDPSEWHTNMPTYASLTYQELYPGIDLRYDGTLGALKGTYVVQPHVDPSAIRWRYEGTQQIHVDAATGDLQISVRDDRMLAERAPVAWQDIGERRVPVAARYTVVDNTVGFNVGAYDPAYPLIIDPELVYATYLGGSLADAGESIALDSTGNIYLTGYTYSDDFPTTGGAAGTNRDVFVTKLDPTGTRLLYSTLIGGRNGDDGVAVAVNAAGEAVVSVTTFSDDFPTKNALLDTLPTGNGALIKLDAAGNLAFSTYLNATMYELHRNVGLDQAGNIYLTAVVDDGDIGVIKLSPDGQQVLAEATIGGRGSDVARAMAVRADGWVYLTGKTDAYSNNFPVTADALQPECKRESAGADASCSREAFLLILDAELQTRYSSFLGGSYFDEGAAIALDRQGNIAVVGTTMSPDFPTRNAVQPACPDGMSPNDVRACNSFETFATKFTPDGKQIVFSTYFSSPDWSADVVKDVAVDPNGVIHLVGWTNSTMYPVKDAPQPNLTPGICLNARSERRCEDAVITAFAPDGALVYSTYLGGTRDEYGYGIVTDAGGNVWVTGQAASHDFPTTNGAFQPQKSINEDGFLVKIGGNGTVPTPPVPTPVNPLSYRVYLPLVQR